MQKLSERLALIASMVNKGAAVCDVGTDHGYLPIFLVRSSIAKSVIATDIREKPLENARKNILSADAKNISLRLCDGLDAVLDNEVDTVIIAGMGGEVISGIISKAKWLYDEKYNLILQPMTCAEELRKFLYENGFEIINEPAVFDNGRVYSVMQVRFCAKVQKMDNFFYFIGKIKPNCKAGAFYIEKQLKRCRECADSLGNIGGKEKEYNYYREIADNLEEILRGV